MNTNPFPAYFTGYPGRDVGNRDSDWLSLVRDPSRSLVCEPVLERDWMAGLILDRGKGKIRELLINTGGRLYRFSYFALSPLSEAVLVRNLVPNCFSPLFLRLGTRDCL